MREWLDKAILVIIYGGVFYGLFFFFKNYWHKDKPKIQKIMSIGLTVLIVGISVICVFDLFTPNSFCIYTNKITLKRPRNSSAKNYRFSQTCIHHPRTQQRKFHVYQYYC